MNLYCLVFVLPWSVVAGYCEGGCFNNGRCYRHGDTWTEDCIERRCRQLHSTSAIVETLRVHCKDAYGRCVRHGDSMYINFGDSLARCKCQTAGDRWYSVQCSTDTGTPGRCDCSTTDGCKSFGEKWTSNDCFTYQCQKSGSSWVGAVVGAACKDVYGACKQHGELFSYTYNNILYNGCLCTVEGSNARYQCGGRDGNTRPTDCHSTGCTVNGVCHPLGSEWTTDCTTYRCEKIGNFWVRAAVVGHKCKDAHGYCRNSGEIMTANIGGLVFNNCICHIVDRTQEVQCSS